MGNDELGHEANGSEVLMVRVEGLDEAISHGVVLLHLSEVGTENSPHVDEWVHESVGQATGQSTRRDLGDSELHEFLVLVHLREHALDGILEHEVESGGWHVTHAVGNVSAPERGSAELGDVAGEAITHAFVTLHLARKNARVRILVL